MEFWQIQTSDRLLVLNWIISKKLNWIISKKSHISASLKFNVSQGHGNVKADCQSQSLASVNDKGNRQKVGVDETAQ